MNFLCCFVRLAGSVARAPMRSCPVCQPAITFLCCFVRLARHGSPQVSPPAHPWLCVVQTSRQSHTRNASTCSLSALPSRYGHWARCSPNTTPPAAGTTPRFPCVSWVLALCRGGVGAHFSLGYGSLPPLLLSLRFIKRFGLLKRKLYGLKR